MRKMFGFILILPLAACSVCKSSDSPELCRTKQRNHSQPRVDLIAGHATAMAAAAARTLAAAAHESGPLSAHGRP